MMQKNSISHFKMSKKLFTALLFLLSSKSSFAAPQTANSFTYNLYADFSYITLLEAPYSSSSGLPKMQLAAAEDQKSFLAPPSSASGVAPKRTFGLKMLKADLSWTETNRIIFDLTLRPDATLKRYQDQTEEAREFDSRAGEVFKEASPITLLDSYRISILQGESLTYTAGVFESLTPYYIAYPIPLAFGLHTMFPEKFAGLKVAFSTQDEKLPTAQAEARSRNIYSLTVLEGDRDRGELLAPSARTHDRATSASDAYKGVAFSFSHVDASGSEYGFLIGNNDSKRTFGKESELIAQLFSVIPLKFKVHMVKLGLDTRYARTSWSQTRQRYHTLEQASGSLSMSYNLHNDQWLALGGHVGSMEKHIPDSTTETDQYRGWQVEMGYIKALSQTTQLSFFANHESRDIYRGSKKRGGFQDSSEASASTLKRFAIELSYTN
jgi:hypothetical protein